MAAVADSPSPALAMEGNGDAGEADHVADPETKAKEVPPSAPASLKKLGMAAIKAE